MNNPQMANDQLKKDLKEILKIKGKITKERPVKGLVKKEAFIRFIENYKFSNDRTLMLKMEHAVDFVSYEESFVQAIEALLTLLDLQIKVPHFDNNNISANASLHKLGSLKFLTINLKVSSCSVLPLIQFFR